MSCTSLPDVFSLDHSVTGLISWYYGDVHFVTSASCKLLLDFNLQPCERAQFTVGTLSVTQPADEKKGNKETNKDLTFPFTTCGKCCNIKVSIIEKGKEPKTRADVFERGCSTCCEM